MPDKKAVHNVMSLSALSSVGLPVIGISLSVKVSMRYEANFALSLVNATPVHYNIYTYPATNATQTETRLAQQSISIQKSRVKVLN